MEYQYRHKVDGLKSKKNDFDYETYRRYSAIISEYISISNEIYNNLTRARQTLVMDYALENAVEKLLRVDHYIPFWNIKSNIENLVTIAKHIKKEAWSAFENYELQCAITNLQSKQREIDYYLQEARRHMSNIDQRVSTLEDEVRRLTGKYSELHDAERELASLGMGDLLGFRRQDLLNKIERINREIGDIERAISYNEQYQCFVSKPLL